MEDILNGPNTEQPAQPQTADEYYRALLDHVIKLHIFYFTMPREQYNEHVRYANAMFLNWFKCKVMEAADREVKNKVDALANDVEKLTIQSDANDGVDGIDLSSFSIQEFTRGVPHPQFRNEQVAYRFMRDMCTKLPIYYYTMPREDYIWKIKLFMKVYCEYYNTAKRENLDENTIRERYRIALVPLKGFNPVRHDI